MTIWVDADACPVVIREILYRAARRTGISLTLVANHDIPVPRAANIRMIRVGAGFDAADDLILEQIGTGDLLVSADITLVAEAMARGVQALHPRGETFSPDTIRARLNMRDFMETMRSSGLHGGGPPPLGPRERQAFAAQLDRVLAHRGQQRTPPAPSGRSRG
ncbi:MAG: YaiI/YqxD family protein [Halothiobacillaceae bacterium]